MPNLINSGTVFGIEAVPVGVEVDLNRGLPAFVMVGLANQAVRESRERVRSALINSGFKYPTKRITINLAPADLKKEGPQFDLPIALGILAGDGIINVIPEDTYIIGELALNGEVQSIRGLMPLLELAESSGFKNFIFPAACKDEVKFKSSLKLFPVNDLFGAAELFQENLKELAGWEVEEKFVEEGLKDIELADIRGQKAGRRAVEIAAAGRHNLILSGPPGTGKTLLARSIQGILPPLGRDELKKVAAIGSAVGRPKVDRMPPWRAPHHSISRAGLVGGGSYPAPGEITLAHQGILFLDELPEFRRDMLELLRQPMEAGAISITRRDYKVDFPADFMLVAAMNPCPCGYDGSSWQECSCSRSMIDRYQAKLSGPLLDRIDIQLELVDLKPDEMITAEYEAESSEEVRKRVIAAREIQLERNRNWLNSGKVVNSNRNGVIIKKGKLNSELSRKELEEISPLGQAERRFLKDAILSLKLSARAVDKIYRLARTIADLSGAEKIGIKEISEASMYRQKNKII